MKADYFSDLLPGSVTHVTQPENDCVTPEAAKVTSENSDLAEASRMSRMSRTKNSNTEQNEAVTEYLEERAAIYEYDAGMAREQAEVEARRHLKAYRYRLRDCPGSELILIAPGENLAEATEGLRRKYGARLIDVCKYEFERHAPGADGAQETGA